MTVSEDLLGNVTSNLPRSSEACTSFFDNCARRRRFVRVPKGDFAKHLEKSKHDFSQVESDYTRGSWDWVVVKAYYAVFHAANALLIRERSEYSKDHACVFVALEHHGLVTPELYRELGSLHGRFSDMAAFDIIYGVRKVGQYDVDRWSSITKEDADNVVEFARRFLVYVEGRCHP
ncbi:MAG: HEPN domain-containing protein [Methanopyri archaeon]|jgi:uncharacterized protein (UPF0332 family)|nr:HEPN domain-containing protein [Methanopyri archaeon]|tara:strand:+ start:103 stop:630 length:528 start_codon:yes stop_codon:yes gene_type:complete